MSISSASSPPRQARGTKGMPHADRRQEIMAAALREFAEHGFAVSSMASVAARAGISKALVYQHFPSKEGLYLACFTGIAEPLVARIEAEMAASPPSSLPINVLNGVFDALGPDRTTWRLFYDPTAPTTGEAGETVNRFRERLTGLALSGVSDFLGTLGEVDPLDVDALARMWTGIVDAVVTWAIDHPDETAEQLTARWTRIVTAIFDVGGRR
ncbi:TetR/AcrR family transcriptional regulator [Amycolatopsis pigmentata]|uniref:TetR/AcrR family transcriptional regulator n=1 Tax=Amycolatopsis pigmentata TaxID=450801 RepID=A0ABW5FPU8_9PSEU